MAALFAALLWAADGWQRPQVVAGGREEWWLVAACAGAAGALLGTVLRMKRRWRWWLLPLGGAALALILPAARETAASNAVRQLLDEFIADDSATPSKFDKTRDALREWLDDKEWPSRWLGKEEDRRDWEDQLSWVFHQLEASRPDLRRRFALATMHQDELRGIKEWLAVAHWRWLFPAVTGQDVTLTQRHRLWDDH